MSKTPFSWKIPDWRKKNGWLKYSDDLSDSKGATFSIFTKRYATKTAVFGITIRRTAGKGSQSFTFMFRLGTHDYSEEVTLNDKCPSQTVYSGHLMSYVDKSYVGRDGSLALEFGLSIAVKKATAGGGALGKIESAPVAAPKALVVEEKETKEFLGLENQGATCYMNSALQALFHVTKFRRIVYGIPTQNVRNEASSIPLNLQALFYNMESSEVPCSTVDLTRSFGWDDVEGFVQHDIQEFMRVLLESIEKNMKDKSKDEIAKLFKGKIIQKIECEAKQYSTETPEDFYDLSLQVRDCPNIRDSLRKYVAKDKIENYDTGDPKIGRQTVDVCMQFSEFPPLLQLHLKRYEFDLKRLAPVKVDSSFEFPVELDLSEFSPKSKQCLKYQLYGVFVHDGHAGGGHYYVYLRPGCQNKWYRFNDSLVHIVDERTAVARNFGGSALQKCTFSAYMLMYVRSDCIKDLFSSERTAIPRHIPEYADRRMAETISDITAAKHPVTVITDRALRLNTTKGIFGLACRDLDLTVKIPLTMTSFEFYDFIAKENGTDFESIRVWKLTSSYELDTVVLPGEEIVSKLRPSIFYLESKDRDEEFQVKTNDIVLFLKVYTNDPRKPLVFFRSRVVSQLDLVSSLIKEVRSPLGLRLTEPVHLFLETAESLLPLDDTKSFRANLVVNGSSILIQPESQLLESAVSVFAGPEEKAPVPSSNILNYYDYVALSPTKSPIEYMGMLKSLVNVMVYPYEDYERLKCTVRVPSRATVSDVKTFLTKALQLDVKDKDLLLFDNDGYEKYPNQKPLDFLPIDVHILYYWIGKAPVNGATVPVYTSVDGYNLDSTQYHYLPSMVTASEMVKLVNDPLLKEGHVRVMTIKNGVIDKVSKEQILVHGTTVVVSGIPKDQLHTDTTDLTQVVHVYIDKSGMYTPFSMPFFLKIAPTDTVDNIRSKIKGLFMMTDEQASHLRFLKSNTPNCKFDQALVLARGKCISDCAGRYLLLIHPKAEICEQTVTATLRIHH